MVNDNPNSDPLGDRRQSIDILDSALIAILAERFRLTEKIGKAKAKDGFEPTDSERERVQLERFRKLASAHQLDEEVAVDIMTYIIQHAKKRHQQLQRDGD